MGRKTATFFDGYTTEGCPFQLVEFHEDGSDMPSRVFGSYTSSDGGGHFDVSNVRDIPWVVYEGDWYRIR